MPHWISILVGGGGAMVVSMSIYQSGVSFLGADGVHKWLRESIESGIASFWATSVVLGVSLMWNGFRCKVHWMSLCQYAIFGCALNGMSRAYEMGISTLSLTILSWATCH